MTQLANSPAQIDVVAARADFALSGWLKLFVLSVCLSIFVAVGWFQWSAYETTLARAENDAHRMAGSLAQHAEDTFEMVDVLLTSLSDRLQVSTRTPEEIWTIGEGVASQLRQVTKIRSIMAYDENGRQFISSQPLVPDWFDITQTEAFDFHRSAAATAILIGKPAKSPSSTDWILPVTRRLSKPDGSFGGILLATLWATYFSDFYMDLNVEHGNISLLSTEGTMLSRSPWTEDKIGANYADQPWFSAILTQPDGSLRFESPVDGVSRVYGYSRAGPYQLTTFVGLSKSTVVSAWARGCVTSVIFAGIAAVLFGLFGLKLVRQVEARQTSESELSKLARTDGLTGLKNRRAFDEVLAAEWKRSTTKPMTLLLLDVDHFKSFNDTYGHVAGDECLRNLAQAIASAVYRPSDHVARYGGEEFAIILPDTNEDNALLVAERVRIAVVNLGITHQASSTSSTVTVSIGLSTQVNARGTAGDASILISDADRALYKAKLVGRNRVETSSLSLVPLSLRL